VAITIKKNKKYYLDRFNELKGEYQSDGTDANDEEKTRYLRPYGRNLDEAKRNSDGERKDEYILNSTALLAIRMAVAFFFSGMTPPTEPWFRLADPDKELNENVEVASFYQGSTERILKDMDSSNFYTAIEQVYYDELTYSRSNIFVDQDFEDIFHFTHIPCGQYYIDTDGKGRVSDSCREFMMRARDMLEEFGEENLSEEVKSMLTDGKTGGEKVNVLHFIERNTTRDVTKQDNQNMPWTSIYYEINGNDDDQKPLKKSGYRGKPNAVPRYNVSSGERYGNGPGDMALGDAKELQSYMKKLKLAVAKDLEPPVLAPDDTIVNTGPNEVTEYNKTTGNTKPVEPLYRVSTDISKILALIIDLQDRIRKVYFNDLFFSQAEARDPKKTATQVRAEQRELLRLLGPITQRMTPELLKPIILRCFDIELDMGRLPDIPEVLQGREIKIDIISSITKAQELSVIAPIEELLIAISQMAQGWPEVLDKFDAVQSVDVIAKALGVPPELVRPDEIYEELQKIKMQAAIQEQQQAQTQGAIEGAEMLSKTDMSGNNALNAIINQRGGGATA
jgi:hypothetical protein